MNCWKWSSGRTDVYYKSARRQNQSQGYQGQQDQGQQDQGQPEEEEELTDDSKTNAINQCLAERSFFNQDYDFNMNNPIFSKGSGSNRREELGSKIAGRDMMAQCGVNPFFQTSYVNDVVTHDIFLKPVNTSYEKEQEKKEVGAVVS